MISDTDTGIELDNYTGTHIDTNNDTDTDVHCYSFAKKEANKLNKKFEE